MVELKLGLSLHRSFFRNFFFFPSLGVQFAQIELKQSRDVIGKVIAFRSKRKIIIISQRCISWSVN